MSSFEQIYVSINHGIFLCFNCACIHQSNYGAEISFVKKLMDERVLTEGQSSLYASSASQAQNSKVLKLSKWTYTQLRVLIISGGNKAFRDYMDQYDLMDEAVQKRYNTVAAQYYRDLIKNKINGGNH
jgi:hypothetical protein